ncbi:unnamed protein product, partial [Polarella glacialis]
TTMMLCSLVRKAKIHSSASCQFVKRTGCWRASSSFGTSNSNNNNDNDNNNSSDNNDSNNNNNSSNNRSNNKNNNINNNTSNTKNNNNNSNNSNNSKNNSNNNTSNTSSNRASRNTHSGPGSRSQTAIRSVSRSQTDAGILAEELHRHEVEEVLAGEAWRGRNGFGSDGWDDLGNNSSLSGGDPGTYGEVTALGARQLARSMGIDSLGSDS